MRRLYLAALAGLVAAAAVALALTLSVLLEVRIEGVVEVPSVRVLDLRLTVDRERGSETFDLGEVEVPGGMLRVRLELVGYEGNFSVVSSGVLRLESGERRYEIPMPCAIAIGEPCYRVMIVIPGYDESMPVEGGTYRATLALEWSARGSGRFRARLYLETVSGQPQIAIPSAIARTERDGKVAFELYVVNAGAGSDKIVRAYAMHGGRTFEAVPETSIIPAGYRGWMRLTTVEPVRGVSPGDALVLRIYFERSGVHTISVVVSPGT